MTCPNCGAQTSSPFCPHCGTEQTGGSAEALVIRLPSQGKYLGNSDYLEVHKTCITLHKAGILGYKTRQLSYRDITAISYQAANGKEGFLCFRGQEDMQEPPATAETYTQDSSTIRFGKQMSSQFHEIYTALVPLVQWNRNPIGPEPLLDQETPTQVTVTTSIQTPQYARFAQCPRCRSASIHSAKRGYSFGWGLVGFFTIPVIGLLLGCIGSKKIRCQCLNCGKRWKP